MSLPESLPARLFLLAYDTDKERLTSRSHLGLVLRAAALTELYLAGRLTDDGGRPRAAGGGPAGDPLADDLVEQIAAHQPRRWHRWIGRGERGAVRAVRDRLESEGHLSVERRTFRPDRMEPRDLSSLKAYAGELRTALGQSPANTDPRTAAILALAARGEVRTVVTRRDRREHRRRLDELAVHTGPIADALRKALRSKRAAAAAVAG